MLMKLKQKKNTYYRDKILTTTYSSKEIILDSGIFGDDHKLRQFR